MSTALVKAEIGRFLRSADPEVLCIKGKWGIGKTFAWLKFLSDISSKRQLGVKKYSYVSLFGLNSLSDLKYSIFENTVSEDFVVSGPSYASFEKVLEGAGVVGRKARTIVSPILSFLGFGDAGDAIARAAFIAVRKQIICIDDLERAGSDLKIRDVLGLASMLKDQRDCKVVLLLNDEQFTEEMLADFNLLLEKVVDISLVFAPTPAEAAEIAFFEESSNNSAIKDVSVKIGITNIRVLKKIERLANRLSEILNGFRSEVHFQAMSTVTIAGWSIFEPDDAPSQDFLIGYNQYSISTEEAQGKLDDNSKRWNGLLTQLGYTNSDELDVAIIDGVQRGYFDEQAVCEGARKVQGLLDDDSRDNSFTKAWDLYHGSLTSDDDMILKAMHAGAMENLTKITPLNINGAVQLLREFDRNDEADELIGAYMEANAFSRGTLDREIRMWRDDPLDPKLQAAFEKLDNDYIDTRDPGFVLRKMASDSGWNDEDIDLMARQSPEDWERIFEGEWGRELYRVAKFAVGLGRHEGENYRRFGKALTEGLKRIAAKSPMRARRIRAYGIELS